MSFEDFDELSDYLAANPGITYTTSSRLEYTPTIKTSNYTKYYYPSDFFRNLETFDGSGIYMDDCRSIGGLFENTTGLKEINIRGWSLDPTKITTDKALSSLVNLERIIVDNGTSLTTDPSFIAQIPKHNNGAWIAQSVTEDADNPKLDSGSNRVFEGMAVLNTSPTTSTNKSLENLYAYTNGGNDHGIVTWEFGYGTFINFEPNRNDAEGYIPSAFLKGGETFSFTKDRTAPCGSTSPTATATRPTRWTATCALLEHRGQPAHQQARRAHAGPGGHLGLQLHRPQRGR